MRLPRQLSGDDLVKGLTILGYEKTRQTSSHIRLTTRKRGEHHVTVPDHKAIPLGTVKSILREVSRHFECSADEIVSRLFGK